MGNCTGSGTHPSTCPMLPSGRDHLLAAISHFFPSIQANVPSPTTLFPLLILSYSLEWPWFVICNQPVIRDSFSLLFAICKQLGGSIKKKKKKSQRTLPSVLMLGTTTATKRPQQDKPSSAPQVLCWTLGQPCSKERLPRGPRCSIQLSRLCRAEGYAILLTAEKLTSVLVNLHWGKRRRKKYPDSQLAPSLS